MKQFNYTIVDPLGIHARPAGMLAKAAKIYADTEITIACNGKTAKAAQLMKVMSLGVKQRLPPWTISSRPLCNSTLSTSPCAFTYSLLSQKEMSCRQRILQGISLIHICSKTPVKKKTAPTSCTHVFTEI